MSAQPVGHTARPAGRAVPRIRVRPMSDAEYDDLFREAACEPGSIANDARDAREQVRKAAREAAGPVRVVAA